MKIQVEFNPLAVDGYRLIGYENRVLAHEDFNDDTKDAGEIGAGHSVTALYEIVPKGERTPGTPRSGAQVPAAAAHDAPPRAAASCMTVAVRFKQPDGARERARRAQTVPQRRSRPMTANLGFASAVAEFGMLLRGSPHAGRASYGAVHRPGAALRRRRSRTATRPSSSAWPSVRRSWPTVADGVRVTCSRR